ncbi:MGH1-like glycoside hydrolase domain-containing protein [Methylovirgula sp. 4M-Z18]|uniref:MGH1-like glycoside hydrolase domain-containing protein n=1 Tax=Methylovirgula sp. 4M-Z18 TaxID=2293567 RepID=UPI000E2FA77C|nr:trehalase family glycosidase [Methylovirgula sp. 4M-Z18]RFB78679.1 glycoside hydrolase family 37 [Methylovirgula sp. 4M-Z18]
MLKSVNIPLERAWNTWSHRPAEMVFLPLGLRLTPMAFAASTGKACLFEPGDGVRLGRHALDASLVELQLAHAGTSLDWRTTKSDPYCISGSWRTVAAGEWGLRFWINLCFSAEGGEVVRFDEAQGAAVLRVGHRFAALVSEAPPVQVTGHVSLAAAAQDYETHGYFYTGSRAQAAPVLALRFNLEMMRDNRFAVAIADREDLAIAKAKTLLVEHDNVPPPAEDGPAVAREALRDVIAWNTVWDGINQRPYTAISRNWDLGKFGGFGVWLNDQLYAALLAGEFDAGLAGENLAAVFSGATPQGNLACLLTANDAWVDRSQSPIGGFVVWQLYLRHGARALLENAYAPLARNHEWWWRERDPEQSGLASFGTSDVGDGLYKGTSFGARNESAMDNSPIHDEARYDPQTRTLDAWDVGLNSLLALDAEMLALIAAELGRSGEAAAFATRAEATRTRIRELLWDDTRGIFANRLRGGGFVKSLAPTSFYPLLAGAASAEQADRLCNHLDDPAGFGGDPVLPGVCRNDPAFGDNSYWRGRIWPPFNFLTYHGLRRYGLDDRAATLAKRSFELFRSVWQSRRICPENYNAETGEPLDQPDTERFYTWGALMAKLGVASIYDVTPWHGWQIANPGNLTELGPFASPLGQVRLVGGEGAWSLVQGAQTLLQTDVDGRISHLTIAPGAISLLLPPLTRESFLRFPQLSNAVNPRVTVDGEAVTPLEEHGLLIPLAVRSRAAVLTLHWMPIRPSSCPVLPDIE